jgi:hypothetical protein
MVAAVFEAEMSEEQARDLARLLDEGRPKRGVTFVDVLEHA